mmetsp:Transcript_1685/g.6723  ORF Transcript_1685/g.6723 Transcript_1685/m.6723 type:complete len:363 (-) Transcript_1685:1091-2179(-)
MKSTGMPRWRSALKTPRWASPLAPPPPMTTPTALPDRKRAMRATPLSPGAVPRSNVPPFWAVALLGAVDADAASDATDAALDACSVWLPDEGARAPDWSQGASASRTWWCAARRRRRSHLRVCSGKRPPSSQRRTSSMRARVRTPVASSSSPGCAPPPRRPARQHRRSGGGSASSRIRSTRSPSCPGRGLASPRPAIASPARRVMVSAAPAITCSASPTAVPATARLVDGRPPRPWAPGLRRWPLPRWLGVVKTASASTAPRAAARCAWLSPRAPRPRSSTTSACWATSLLHAVGVVSPTSTTNACTSSCLESQAATRARSSTRVIRVLVPLPRALSTSSAVMQRVGATEDAPSSRASHTPN